MKNNTSISLVDCSFSYTTGQRILSNVSLDVDIGERVALIGPNGAGKTTLFLLLCGILAPTDGTITVKDKKVKHNQFNQAISYLFQSPDDQLFSSTVIDDVTFGPLNSGLTQKAAFDQAEVALASVNCQSLRDKPPHNLSGGEKRMVALATLLAMQPEIMLLDEPTSNLDMKNRRAIITLLCSLKKTLLISSHDLEFLLETCSRAIILDQGTIVADGPIRTLLADEDLMQAHHMEKPHSLFPHTHRRSVEGIPRDH